MYRYRHRQLKKRGEPEVNPISREVLFGQLVLPVIRELNKKKEEVLKVFRFLMTDKFSQ